MMRLGRVAGQTTESEAGGDGSAWIGVLTKRQSGEQRQSLDGFGSGQQKKDMDALVGMRQAQGPTPLHSARSRIDHLDRAHPVRRLTAFGMATEIIPMFPSATSSQHLLFLIIIPE
jgi:hypothetical protein